MNLIMLSRKLCSCWFLSALVFVLAINLCYSLPLPKTIYSSFVDDLQANHCTLPGSILISNRPNQTAESSLQICNSTEYLKYNKEVAFLCNETLNLLKNISCPPVNIGLKEIQFTFSDNICKDFDYYKNLMPDGLLKHLTDNFTCHILCPDDVNSACQVLLWSSVVKAQYFKSKSPEPLPTKVPADINTDHVGKSQENQQTINTDQEKGAVDNDLKVIQTKEEALDPNTISSSKSGLSINKGTTVSSTKSENNLKITTIKDVKSDPAITNPEPTVEKYNAEKAIDEDQPQHVVTSATNSTAGKNTPPASGNQNGVDIPIPIVTNKQPSDLSKSTQTKTNEFISTQATQNTNQDHPEEAQKEKTLKQDESKQETKSPVAQVADTKLPTNLEETHEDKGELQKIDEVAKEETTIPKSDQPSKVSDTISSSEPSSMKDSEVSSKSPTPNLEKMDEEIPMPNEKDTDQYTDLENGDAEMDGEYPKQEYGVYEPSKTQRPASEAPKTANVPKESVSRDDSLDFNRIPSRDNFGRGSEEIKVLTTFPEEEDGHFFVYLLTLVLFSMGVYLLFHNKQKIIALIVEGRHEHRRRSRGLGYRKLESK